jgi:putative transposase
MYAESPCSARDSVNATDVYWAAVRFTQRLADATGVAPSTGSVGDSFDNALAENLWSTIKTELIYWPDNTFATRAEADSVIFRYIDGWYNPRRIQEGLGGLSPCEYEEAWRIRQQTGSATIPVESGES